MPLLDDPSNWVRIFGASNVTSGSWDNVKEKSMNQVLLYTGLLIVCYVLTELILKQITDWKDLKLKKLAGSISMYPAFFVMVYTSHLGTADPKFAATLDYQDRYHSSTDIIDMFANFYIAANIVQAIGQIQTEKPPLLYQLMVHHVLSIACYTSAFYFDRFHWWEAFAGSCELTNIFLVPVFACKEFFPEWQEQTWYLWNSRFLWFFFVIHRLILFPCWLGLWFWDRIQAVNNGEPDLHWVEGIGYPVTIFGLLILSIIWFRAIGRGLRKQTKIYRAAQEAKQRKAKQN